MSKKVLILSGSPRKGGNSDLLCDEFLKGARESGNQKEFFYIMTAAEDSATVMDCTLECFRGFARCLNGAREMGGLCGKGVYEAGAIAGTPVMGEAYEMGKRV